MSDQDVINAGLAEEGVITDLTARIIASAWHGGQSSPLYSLASCGAIVEGVSGEIASCRSAAESEHWAELDALAEYVESHEDGRRPVRGWSDLHW